MQDRAVVLADIAQRFGRRTGYAFADKDTDRITRAKARDAYATDMNDAWRSLDGQPGDACTAAGGQPGRVCREGDKLVCRPLKSGEPSDREWQIAGPLSDAQCVELKDAALKEYEERIQNAWRR